MISPFLKSTPRWLSGLLNLYLLPPREILCALMGTPSTHDALGKCETTGVPLLQETATP